MGVQFHIQFLFERRKLQRVHLAKISMAVRDVFFFINIAFVIISTYASVIEDTNEPIEFSYFGANGPAKWGSLNPKFSLCSNGKHQSPIDIVKDKAVHNKNLKPLNRDYYPVNATLVNNIFNIGMHYDGYAGVLISDGKNYTLKQMHWHSPSEHRIDGVQYAAELHLVHIAGDGSISAVGILYEDGDSDPLVAQILNKLHELAKETCASHEQAQIAVGTFNTKQMKRSSRKYYKYVGSLTSPPCTENVTWNILGKVRSISKEQVEALKAPLGSAFKNNSRPVQPQNERQVELYDELQSNSK